MGRMPPNTVGIMSPTLRSSILRSPDAVEIRVPFRKQLVWRSASAVPTLAIFAAAATIMRRVTAFDGVFA
jgi:hypothetical protein